MVDLYHGDVLSVGDLQCVLDFLVLYLKLNVVILIYIGVMFSCDHLDV